MTDNQALLLLASLETIRPSFQSEIDKFIEAANRLDELEMAND